MYKEVVERVYGPGSLLRGAPVLPDSIVLCCHAPYRPSSQKYLLKVRESASCSVLLNRVGSLSKAGRYQALLLPPCANAGPLLPLAPGP